MHLSLRQYTVLLNLYLAPQRRRVVALAALLLASIALQLANPQIVRAFLDGVGGGEALTVSLRAGGAWLVLGTAQHLVGLAALYLGETVGWTATNALRSDLTLRCLRLDLAFHKRYTPGELIQRIDGDAATLNNFFSHFTLRVAGNGLLIIGILALLWREDWRLGLGLTLYALVTLAVLGWAQRVAVPRWAREREANAAMYGFLEERFAGLEEIRSSGAEPYILDRLHRLMRRVLRATVSAQIAGNLTVVTARGLALFAYALALALAAYLYTRGDSSIGAAYVIVYYVGMLGAPLEEMRAQAQDMGQAAASAARVLALSALEPQLVDPGPAAEPLPVGPLSVDLQGVSFAYAAAETAAWLPTLPADDESPAPEPPADAPAAEGEVFALHSVDLALAPGQLLGLLGRTGSGKSTLTRLLFRLYDPQSGVLCLGGRDLRRVAHADLRARVGLITQNVELFTASLRDNLTLFDPAISDAQLMAALEMLGLREWVATLPGGLDTPLGAGGRGLSAGEAQLLAFTRVFLRDPGLIILDEASSRLDPATEALLEQAIDRLLAGRTGIIIAHRLHTVSRATHIAILEGGRVLEHGPRVALAQSPGSRFAHLLAVGMEELLA